MASKERTVYYDIIRVFACFFVIMVHASAPSLASLDPRTLGWQISNGYSTVSLAAPAIFLMLSGAIFLDPSRNVSLKALYGKYILRLVTAYLFWSCVNTLIIFIPHYTFSLQTLKAYWQEVTLGVPLSHFWFIPALISIYLILPVLREAFRKKEVCEYFLILYAVVQLIVPVFLKFDFTGKITINSLLYRIPYVLCTGYVGYFVLGHYLSAEDFAPRKRWLLYGLGALGIVSAILIDGYFSARDGVAFVEMNDILTINLFLFAAAVFVAIKYIPWKKGRFTAVMSWWSRLTFGIYLIHLFVLNRIMESFPCLQAVPLLFRIPLYAFLTFLICTPFIWLLSRIPIVNKYLI